MARSGVNKSQMIRDALAAHRTKTPSEIAEVLKGQGIHVTGTYVSNVKFNSRTGRRRAHTVSGAARRTRGPRRGGRGGAGSFSHIPAALKFINDVGGLKAAKATLATVEEIGNSVR
jgi:hypothetical protein